MPSQVYTNNGDDEYRVVPRERNGALIFARPDYSGGSMNIRKPRSRFFSKAHRQVF